MRVRPLSDDPAAVTAAVDHAGAAQAAVAATGVDPACGVEAATASPESAPASAIAAAIAAGQLDASAAAERLIAATVASQRPAGASPAAWEDVAREVSALLAGDPALADLLAPL